MKTIPFPYALNIGTDIVHLPRITRLLTHRANYLTRFTQRILTDAEQRDFHRRFKGIAPAPVPATSASPAAASATATSTNSRTPPITPEMTRWLAGRFAAKEAARKAAPAGAASLGWKDVIVRVEEDSRVGAVDHATRVGFGSESGSGSGSGSGHTARDGTSRRPEIVYLHGEEARSARLSISHDGEYVVATVLAAG